MPSFFGDDGKTPIDQEVFGGNAEKQINALTKYVIEFVSLHFHQKFLDQLESCHHHQRNLALLFLEEFFVDQ